MLVVEVVGQLEGTFRERDARKAREFTQLLADQHNRCVAVLRVRGKRRTLLHQMRKQRLLGRS